MMVRLALVCRMVGADETNGLWVLAQMLHTFMNIHGVLILKTC